MKQIIVMIAMIGLGIAIAGFVMGFNSTASDLATAAKNKISYDLVTANP